MNYDEAVAYMSGLLLFGIRLDRERFVDLLARIGDPHKKLRCVHVAGTNGKGSTTAFIASVLRAAGYRTGAYFSPYVYDLRERIQIDGAMIPRDALAHWVSIIRPHAEALDAETDLGPTTEFEMKTAVAFCYFADREVDFSVLEVGLGGRLDATNVIGPPLAAVITSIGLDHTHILGDTLAKIAREKAGILKPGTICVTAVPPGEARDAIAEVARANDVPMLTVAPIEASDARTAFITYQPKGDASGARIWGADTILNDLPPLGMRGAYQLGNAALAVAAIRVLRERHGVAIAPEAVRAGLTEASLPGRFQTVREGDPILLLDVAHNEDGARVLVTALADAFPGKRFVFVIGMTRNHAPEPFLRILAPLIDRLIVTAPAFRAQPVSETARAAHGLGMQSTVLEPASEAIRKTWEEAQPGEVVVVTGSLYTVGATPPDLRGAL